MFSYDNGMLDLTIITTAIGEMGPPNISQTGSSWQRITSFPMLKEGSGSRIIMRIK